MHTDEVKGSGRPSGRFGRRSLMLLLATGIVCAGWSAVWATIRSRLIDEVDAQVSRLDRGGVRIVCPDRGVGGFPFRLEITCRDPGLELVEEDIGGSVTALRIVAQIWDPHLILVEADGPMIAEERGRGRVEALWRGLRVSLRWSTAGLERLSLSSEGLDLTVAETGAAPVRLRAEHFEAHARPSGAGGSDLDLAGSIAAGALSIDGRPIGPQRSDLAASTTLRRLLPPAPGDMARTFASRGGKIDSIRASFSVGGVRVEGKGAMTLGSDGLLDGSIGFAAKGLEAVVTDAGTLGPEATSLLGAFVLLGKASSDPDLPGRRLDLIMDHGRPRFGRIVMAPMKPLFDP